MLETIEINCHSSIKIKSNKIIYIDPFRIKEHYEDANFIFITHNHYDHFSPEDIKKVKNKDTTIIITEDLYTNVLKLGFNVGDIVIVKPNEIYKVMNLEFKTVSAYNINKSFHPEENEWVGYVININNVKYYIAGDTDITKENRKVKCDVALVPIGGTYTMNSTEAAELVNEIKPKIAIPTHYAEIVGTKQDAENFKKLLSKEIECRIII